VGQVFSKGKTTESHGKETGIFIMKIVKIKYSHYLPQSIISSLFLFYLFFLFFFFFFFFSSFYYCSSFFTMALNNKAINGSAANPPRLTHPTKYHLQMQQQRLARDNGHELDQQQFVIDPLAFQPHIFFPPQKTSPHLSDMDYTDLPDNLYADSPTSNSLVQDDLLYDELSTPPMDMKRSFNPHYPMYIQSPPSDKGFAMSAPANIGGFAGDQYSSIHSTTSSSLKYPQTPTIGEEGDVGSYEDDYATQAK
jgi:hypothetical protein